MCLLSPHALTRRLIRAWRVHGTQNQFDSIDLSDNEIRKVECLAVLPRIKMLLLNNNRINRCVRTLPAYCMPWWMPLLLHTHFNRRSSCTACLSLGSYALRATCATRAMCVALRMAWGGRSRISRRW